MKSTSGLWSSSSTTGHRWVRTLNMVMKLYKCVWLKPRIKAACERNSLRLVRTKRPLSGLQATCAAGMSLPSTPSSDVKLHSSSQVYGKKKRAWSICLDAQTLKLARTEACFAKIESDPRLGYDLHRCGATAGQVISHAKAVIQRALDSKSPMTFKVGFTHCAWFRFYNRTFGYIHARDGWEGLCTLYAASDLVSPAYLEAALIHLFQGS